MTPLATCSAGGDSGSSEGWNVSHMSIQNVGRSSSAQSLAASLVREMARSS